MIIDKLQRVNQTRVFEYASDQIRELIKEGQLQPGEKLPTEQELCDALNMSRSSIREAIRVLEAEGLIEVRRGAGTFVNTTPKIQDAQEALRWLQPRQESLLQILQVRECIERFAVREAALNHPNSLIEELEQLVEQYSTILKEGDRRTNLPILADLNTRFHLAICKATGNDIAYEFLHHLMKSFSVSNKAVIHIDFNLNHQVFEHKAILAAIKSGDPEMAEKAMRAHISRVYLEVKQIKH